MDKQIRILTINKGENAEATLYRLEKEWVLRFILGPSLQASTVRFFCNHPVDVTLPFDRKQYTEIPWECPTSMKSDRHDVYAQVKICIAGTFNYYFTIDNSSDQSNANGHGYFLVDPTLRLGPPHSEQEITLDCIQCQSVLSKNMGPLGEWESRLQVAKETGYNMIHFTPIQELGVSNSAYSLKNQNRLNPEFHSKDTKYDFDYVETLVTKMKSEWRVLSLTDLVFNHTAINSDWILEHPECVYNLRNSPHLRPAYSVDRIFSQFNKEVADRKWEHRGIPAEVSSEAHLDIIKTVLLHDVFPQQKLEEFWSIDLEKTLKDFKNAVEDNKLSVSDVTGDVTIVQDPEFRRLQSSIDLNILLKHYNTDRPGVNNRQERITACCEALKQKLEELNASKKCEMSGHIETAVNNFIANARYRFLADDGPKIPKVSQKEPLMFEYFIQPKNHIGSVEKEERMGLEEGQFVMATNGWVMNDNPLRNFAEPGSNIYLRRELVNWGDSVKLRYGATPAACPCLWEHMRTYTETTAKIFHGVRLDNCHSTPIHVAEYMMDAARAVRPDLYVIAELFTGSEHLDNLFINKLGINSLIREAMSAWDAHEQGRLVHRYGGLPVGAFIQPHVQPLVPTMAHAIFFDQTHDNKCPIEVRSVYDILPSAALVSMACCASGSNRGYDELVPHHIHVVTEDRRYTRWSSEPDLHPASAGQVNLGSGILGAKKLLNHLHFMLGCSGFTEVYIDQVDVNTVCVTRHNPATHESIVCIARMAFNKPVNPHDTSHIRPLNLPGVVTGILFEGRLVPSGKESYTRDSAHINGLPGYRLEMREHIGIKDLSSVALGQGAETTDISFVNFTPGSVIALSLSMPQPAREAILEIRKGLQQFGFLMRSYSGRSLTDNKSTNFRGIVSRLSLDNLNKVLYRTDAEEKADGNGSGAYSLDGVGPMVFCGLQGIVSHLSHIRPKNDLGHSLCDNLRRGDWLPGYVVDRLMFHEGTKELAGWFAEIFLHLKNMPRYIIPCYFDAIIVGAYMILRDQALSLMSDFVNDGSTFIHALAMGSVQFCGVVNDARLPALSPNLSPPVPATITDSKTGKQAQLCLSLAAGFPHFAAGFMRSWGRDTFIALRGLLLLTGRYQDARYLILSFAGCLRHGLLPNLLDEGVKARYNCRDSVWWWLQCIQDYTATVPGGEAILGDVVSRLYPSDDAEPQELHDQPLHDVIQEALQRHAEGVTYRERNAGVTIDTQMSDKGFDTEIGVDWNTGFVRGGNEHNCGTWMDKMGSSEKAGNKGKPATPRDGSPVELVGLCRSALCWLNKLNKAGIYPYNSVETLQNGGKVTVTFEQWCELIKDNFERCFWVNTEPVPEHEPAPDLITRRGIYKDCHLATQFWTDHQLRPNFVIAMVTSPELFSPHNAWTALELAEEVLVGPLGMKTLDPKDWSYVGDYINSDDSADPNKANGFNYHQGPEWLWPLGYFLRAKLHFAAVLDSSRPGLLNETLTYVKTTLTAHYEAIMASPWQSLPELTNSDGKVCHDSCPAQAWSVGCLLEVLHDLEQMEPKI